MNRLLHKILYRILPLEWYLIVVSRLFFVAQRLGIGRHSEALEYIYHLDRLVGAGDTAIDIGANLGYYSRTIARLVGGCGALYSVEPVKPILGVLRRNLSCFSNVEILNFALGCENKSIKMANNSALESGYFGTGRNFVNESGEDANIEFEAQMRRGSELFAGLERLDFVKCDIEGYEVVVMSEMRPLFERFHPRVLIETGGANRAQIIEFFTSLGYQGYTLHRGDEVALTAADTKDIIFRYTTK